MFWELGGWKHNIVNALNAMELFTLKWSIFFCDLHPPTQNKQK